MCTSHALPSPNREGGGPLLPVNRPPHPRRLSYSPQSLFLEDEFQTPVVEHQGADRGGPRDAGQQMRRPEEGGGAEEGGDGQTSPRPGGHGLRPLPRSADAGVRKERKGTARATNGKADWILFDVFQQTQVQD